MYPLRTQYNRNNIHKTNALIYITTVRVGKYMNINKDQSSYFNILGWTNRFPSRTVQFHPPHYKRLQTPPV